MARIELTATDGRHYHFGDAQVVSVEPETGEPNADDTIDYLVRVRSTLAGGEGYLSIYADGYQPEPKNSYSHVHAEFSETAAK